MTPEARVSAILRQECAVTAPFTRESRLAEQLGLDSVGFLTLALELENHYQLTLEEDPQDPPRTVGDLVRLVEARLKEAGSDE